MEAGMRVFKGAWSRGPIAASCLLLALQVNLAQNTAQGAQNAGKSGASSSSSEARSVLVDKAHALEARGRPDMALQEWQQILLSEPKNLDALAGVARDLKLMGSDKAGEALEKLRSAYPNDPSIARIQSLPSTHVENEQLGKAGELAKEGRNDEAMRVYRQLRRMGRSRWRITRHFTEQRQAKMQRWPGCAGWCSAIRRTNVTRSNWARC
jgi:tetratricopeptide (TPR) repeat protein